MSEQKDGKVTVVAECESCQGYGVLPKTRPFKPGITAGLAAELRIDASQVLICRDCKGSGSKKLTYQPFTGRHVYRRSAIKTVHWGQGSRVHPKSGQISYVEFLEGKTLQRPEEKIEHAG